MVCDLYTIYAVTYLNDVNIYIHKQNGCSIDGKLPNNIYFVTSISKTEQGKLSYYLIICNEMFGF